MKRERIKGVFVTGTDTNVGKTLVTGALVESLRSLRVPVLPMKPIQTGCRYSAGKLLVPDVDLIVEALNLNVTRGLRDLMCQYKFHSACSPHLAVRRESSNGGISIPHIVRCFHKLAGSRRFVVVEGAGGVLVPISHDKMMLDVMKALDIPVILVARTSLGTINHSLLSLQALRGAGLKVMGVVFNQVQRRSAAYVEDDNVNTVAALGNVPVLGRLKYQTIMIEKHIMGPTCVAECCMHRMQDDTLPMARKIAEQCIGKNT